MNRLRAPAAAPSNVYPVKARIEFLISILSKNAANTRTRRSKIAASANSKSASKTNSKNQKQQLEQEVAHGTRFMTIPDFLPFPAFS